MRKKNDVLDLYLTSLAVGGIGLGAMAASGFLHHAGHSSHGHAAHGHGSTGHGAAGHGSTGHGSHGHAAHALSSQVSSVLLSLMSPRVLFSFALGLGTTGLALRPVLGGITLLAVSIAGGVVLERLFVTPIWNFAFRFESAPAATLESAAGGDAVAVTSFNALGEGLVAVEVDGQMIQLLGTLTATDRGFRGKVSAGTKLCVENVDAARNRCTVSLQ